MLVLIFIISLVILAISVISADYNDVAEITGALSFIVCGISGVVIFFMLISFPHNVDKKIELYEVENKVIEEKIKNTVRNYMEYEEKVYNDLLKDSDLTTMVLKYPELNSNELIKAEIETYKENSKKLKELKEDKISKSTKAWWLYFGK